MIAIASVLLLALAAYFFYPKLFSSNKEVDVLDKSIAALPFENMSGDPEQEYFSDGIAEEILNSLSQLEGLKVTGRTSSFQFKGKDIDLKEVGEKLGVATILEGSIRKQNNQLRIYVQLVSAKDGYQLWSQRFDRKVTDVFAIQDEIAQAVSAKLKLTLLHQPSDGPGTSMHNQEAYDLYLQGRFFFNKRGPGLLKGLELFKKSVALDSTFAQAQAAIALSYAIMSYYYAVPSVEGLRETKKFAQRAIELDPNSSDAYTALGFVAQHLERDWNHTRQFLQKAIALNPSNTLAHGQYNNYFLFVAGDFVSAEAEAMKALKLDPYYFLPHVLLGQTNIKLGRYDRALENCQKAIEVSSNSSLPYTSKADVLLLIKKPAEAIETLTTNMGITGRTQMMLASLCEALAEAGKKDEAVKIYNEVRERARTEYVAPFILGRVAVAIGKLDEAYKWYDKAFQEKNSGFIYWKYFLHEELDHWSVFKKDPRYKRIMDQLAFPVE